MNYKRNWENICLSLCSNDSNINSDINEDYDNNHNRRYYEGILGDSGNTDGGGEST